MTRSGAESLSTTPHTLFWGDAAGGEPAPSVSVVIPTHNRAALVQRAISSVLAQTHRDLELIVVDDASTDHTRQVVATVEDARIRYVRHQTNGHASASRNTGIAHARGEYLAFLDDDDEWAPTKLAVQLALLRKSPPEIGLVYCWLDYVDAENRIVSELRPTLKGDVFLDVLDMQRLGNSSTLLLRRHIAEEVEGFDETLPRGNDGDFIRRVCQRYHVYLVP